MLTICKRYGVDMTKPEAQAWLDSVYTQYAQWGLGKMMCMVIIYAAPIITFCISDLIKNDCVYGGNWHESGPPLINGVKNAIMKGGHPTVYSLSPGGGDAAMGRNISEVADMYRITGDWHDCDDGRWGKSCGDLTEHFVQAHAYESLIGKPSFPDLDIIRYSQNQCVL